jgi:hypothetical protein
MKSYKFQALVTLGPPPGGGPPAVPGDGLPHRLVVRGQRHDMVEGQRYDSGISKFFSALATTTGDASRWSDDDHLIMTIVLTDDEPREYFEVGDSFTVWLGQDLGRGVVTRRLFI